MLDICFLNKYWYFDFIVKWFIKMGMVFKEILILWFYIKLGVYYFGSYYFCGCCFDNKYYMYFERYI